MKAKLQHITAIAMAFLLLFSSAGVPVYEHFCRSSNFHEVSVWPITKCQTKTLTQHTCCKTQMPKCCAGKSAAPATTQEHAEKSCCTYNTDYLALASDRLVSGSLKQELPLPAFTTDLLPAAFHDLTHLFVAGNANSKTALHKPPALLQTRSTAAVLQIFLC